MPAADGILINICTINESCVICDQDLSDRASLNLTFGYQTVHVCVACLQEIFESYPGITEKVDELEAQIESLRKELKTLQKTSKKSEPKAKKEKPDGKAEAPKAADQVPEVSDEDQVRDSGEQG